MVLLNKWQELVVKLGEGKAGAGEDTGSLEDEEDEDPLLIHQPRTETKQERRDRLQSEGDSTQVFCC